MPQQNSDLVNGWRVLVGAKNFVVGTAIFGSWLYNTTRKPPQYQPPPLENTHPMEGMAVKEDLTRYEYKRGAIYLGNIHPSHGVNFKAGISDDRHCFIVSGNAGGKGRSILINNALRWSGGFFALDVKGELASITAMRRGKPAGAKGTGTSVRRFLGQEVAILDPFDQTEGASRIYKKRYNPLVDVDIHSINGQADIKKISSACIVPEQGANEWVSRGAERILSGVIEAVLLTCERKNHNLAYISQWIDKPFEELLFLLEDRDPNDNNSTTRGRIPHGGLASKASGLLKDCLDTDAQSAYRGSLSDSLSWVSEPQAIKQLQGDNFSLKKLIQSGGSVYVVVPPDRIDEFKSWLRIIVQTAFTAKIEMGVYQTTIPTLFMLDEFPLLGKFNQIEKSAGFLRGYNCKLVYAIQNIGQIKTLYTANWETFLGNAGAIIGFATNDLETEEYLSKRTGKIRAWETSYSINSGASHQGVGGSVSDGKTTSQAQRERAVMFSNEIHDVCGRDTGKGLIVTADGKPFFIERQNYDDIPQTGLFDSPDFIQAWERQHGGKVR